MCPILGCHKPVDGSFRCECGWPMCSKECCLSFIHKGIYEHGLTTVYYLAVSWVIVEK